MGVKYVPWFPDLLDSRGRWHAGRRGHRRGHPDRAVQALRSPRAGSAGGFSGRGPRQSCLWPSGNGHFVKYSSTKPIFAICSTLCFHFGKLPVTITALFIDLYFISFFYERLFQVKNSSMTRVTRLLHYWTQREALTPTNKIDMFVKRCLAGYLARPVPSGAGVATGGRGFGQAPPTAIKKKK